MKKGEKMRKPLVLVLLICSMFFLSSCAGAGSQVKKDYPLKTKVTIQGDLLVNPVEDLTAGQVMDKEKTKEIYDAIVSRVKSSGKYSLTEDKNKASYVFNIRMIEFTAGNRALRFWIGYGSGAAKLHFMCQLLDKDGKVVDEQHFQRFGAASLRSGPAIIEQMKNLTIDYACSWLQL